MGRPLPPIKEDNSGEHTLSSLTDSQEDMSSKSPKGLGDQAFPKAQKPLENISLGLWETVMFMSDVSSSPTVSPGPAAASGNLEMHVLEIHPRPDSRGWLCSSLIN